LGVTEQIMGVLPDNLMQSYPISNS
jgi:hypothetical protein